jgi:hypothetical protein
MLWLLLTAGLALAHIPDVTYENLDHELQNYSDYADDASPTRTAVINDWTRLVVNYILVDVDVTSSQKLYLINKVITPAKHLFYHYVEAQNLPAAATGDAGYHWTVPETCAGFEIPKRLRFYKVSGATVHIFVFGSKSDGNHGSWGAPCVVDDNNSNEPVFGAIWINTADFDLHSDHDNFHNMVRQTIHVLAFHPLLYDLWRDVSNRANTYTDSPVFESTTSVRGKEKVQKIRSPTVLANARTMFGCATLDGVELEESFVETGVPSANWERRVMFNDVMTTGQGDNDPIVISGITWALLVDSGWYDIETSSSAELLAHSIAYGFGKGCGFLDNKCVIAGTP